MINIVSKCPRFDQSHRPRVVITSDNPYQVTTQPIPHQHAHNHQKNVYNLEDNRLIAGFYRNGPSETCPSETETPSYYDYYYPDHGYQTGGNKKEFLRNADCVYSDDSGSTRLPYYEYEDILVRRQSKNTSSDRSGSRRAQAYKEEHNSLGIAHKDARKIYPNQEGNVCERVCFDGTQRFINEVNATANLPRRPLPLSRASDRPQSAQSSSVTSSIVHGCGGRCQTFENVCYYFLQVAFTMGILIGTSLGIAGAVLRKSAARNLQVLVYIGAMLSLVSALLLSVQCSAKHSARKRKKALKNNAKRGPILLEQLPPVRAAEQPLMDPNLQRGLPITIIPMSAPVHQVQRPPQITEQQGVPWWRRKDLEPFKR